MPKQNVSGKTGYLKWSGTKINITSWSGSVDIKMADTTDSADYDSTSDLVWNTQVAASGKGSFDIEGNYDLSGSQGPLIAKLLSGSASAVTGELGFTASTPFGWAKFDVSNFKPKSPVEDTVTFTATIVTNGKFSLGAAP